MITSSRARAWGRARVQRCSARGGDAHPLREGRGWSCSVMRTKNPDTSAGEFDASGDAKVEGVEPPRYSGGAKEVEATISLRAGDQGALPPD